MLIVVGSTFTLLFQDSAGGLEFEDRSNKNEFLPAAPDGDKLYLNVGDMLMRLSNSKELAASWSYLSANAASLTALDHFPSATHRVAVPQSLHGAKEQMTSARYSIPYFVLPDDDAVIFPQASCVGANGKAQYERTTLVDYAAYMSKWQYEDSGHGA